ncbi:MAG: hypothetical protein ABEJ31_02320 [Haloarculaceae archaeon]
MRQTLRSALAVAVVTVLLVGGAAGAGQPRSAIATDPAADQVVAGENTTSHLPLPAGDVRTSRFADASLDVASAVAIDGDRYDQQLLTRATIEAFEAADTADNRTAILRRAADAIDNRSVALMVRQQRAIDQYNGGQLSTRELLRELAVVDARARTLTTVADRLHEHARNVPGYALPNSLRTRLKWTLKGEPLLLEGPVRNEVRAAVTGASDHRTVYVATTGQGVVLSTIDGDRVIREAFLGSRYDHGGSDHFDVGLAYERVKRLYPWTTAHSIANPYTITYGSIYRTTIDHTQGQLVTVIDGSTTNVVREVQEKRLAAIPVNRTVTGGTADLRVRANLTHQTGPMQLTVLTAGGDPVPDARIRVDDHLVGRTDDAGRLWTVQPVGTASVNATTADGESATLSLSG